MVNNFVKTSPGSISNKMNSSQVTQNSWYIPIDKLMVWRNSWTKYDRKISNFYLRVVYDQIFITADTKILESFNIHHKLKGIYKEDVLILILSDSNHEIRKIKFQIKSNVSQCLDHLSCHFPVVNHNILQSNKTINPKYRSIAEVLKYAVEQKGNIAGPSNHEKLPKEFESFVKLCLLDPTFPLLVFETEKVLNNIINKN